MENLFGGIDGCRGGWILVYGNPLKQISYSVFRRLPDILEKIEKESIKTAVDMAVGLNRISKRKCDCEAAKRLKKKKSSVFPMPGSCAVEKVELPYFGKGDYRKFRDFNEQHRKLCQRGIPLATFCIMNKLYEINNECSAKVKELQCENLLFEFHPELFFYRIQPALPRKKTPDGIEKRREIIQSYCSENIDFGALLEICCRDKIEGVKVHGDDFVDAAAGMILSFRFAQSQELYYPDEDISENGLRISIRY